MSLYNMLFGTNPMAPLLQSVIGIPAPRFRDAWYDPETKHIVIFTRTGGGNRDFYECEERCREHYPEMFEGTDPPTGPWNDDLRGHPNFVEDSDDARDCTYARFEFSLPEKFAFLHEWFISHGSEARDPAAQWEGLFTKLSSGNMADPAVARAHAFLEPLIVQLRGFSEEAKGGTPPDDEEVAHD